MTADLHLHTHYSDGNWSPQELVDAAVKLGFDCIAVTDHDTTAAIDESIAHAANRIRIIRGIEFNTIWVNPDGNFQDVHILGYFIDPQNEHLQEAIAAQQEARVAYVHETLSLLSAAGYDIKFEHVRTAGKGSLGRPHVCMAMLKAQAVSDIQKAYKMLMNRDSPFRVIRRSISPDEAIKAIHSAGGISSLAHPAKEPHMVAILDHLCKVGLDGIEAYHRSHTLSMVRKYSKIARTRKLLITGGSDCHGPFENYPASIGTIRLVPDLVHKLDQACRSLPTFK